jgi:hypothetical protein
MPHQTPQCLAPMPTAASWPARLNRRYPAASARSTASGSAHWVGTDRRHALAYAAFSWLGLNQVRATFWSSDTYGVQPSLTDVLFGEAERELDVTLPSDLLGLL